MASRITFDINPHFVFLSPLREAASTTHALAEHVDHAIIALNGRAPFAGETTVEILESPASAEALRIDLWVNDLDDVTCTYGFTISSADGRTPHARGERSIVNLDPYSRRPAPWTAEFRTKHANLLRDLPAYG